jgi:HEPN domain-containing protein
MLRLKAARFRLVVARGYLGEARQDVGLSRWRACADGSQLAAESAAKAVVALVAVVGRTHEPGEFIRLAVEAGRYPDTLTADLTRLSELAKTLGPQVHIESDYGDEKTFTTPWELFDEARARDAFATAVSAVELAESIVAAMDSTPPDEG